MAVSANCAIISIVFEYPKISYDACKVFADDSG